MCVIGAGRRERLPSVLRDAKRGRKRWQYVEGLCFIGKQRVRIPAHCEVDIAVPRQTLGQLWMHPSLGDERNVTVPERVKVCESARRIDVNQARGL